jgi:WD40 repeat protein
VLPPILARPTSLQVAGSFEPGPIDLVVLSIDGKRIVTRSADNTIKLWDATRGREPLSLKQHANDVNSVVFSPRGKRTVTGTNDKTVKV